MALDSGILILTLVIGPLIAVLIWSLIRKSAQEPTGSKGKEAEKSGKKAGKPKTSAPTKPSNKNAKNKTSAKDSSKAKFTHSWLLTSLKGHTGPVTDLDFSSDGKHLVSCSEDDVFVTQMDMETPTPSEISATDSGCVLSRRQKRNRSKKTNNNSVTKKAKEQVPHQTKSGNTNKQQRLRRATPLKYYVRLQMKNAELYSFLLQYVLPEDQLINLGYPVESPLFYPGRAIFYKTPEATYYRTGLRRQQKETIEIAEQLYSGNDSNCGNSEKPLLSPSLEKRCVRCKKGFFVTLSGEYLTEESCVYHWGQWMAPSHGHQHGYTCCHGGENSTGCTTGKLHVWNGVNAGMNVMEDYVTTMSGAGPRSRSVYALDCEMCYTGCGLEVCKVTLINIDGSLVYETLVKPQRKVVDYNTRYSGLSQQDLERGPVRTMKQVQRDLLGFIYKETILIGHGLENDLRALCIIHSNVIDTAVLFPHYFGFPFRRSLKKLVETYLQRKIQTGHEGHDSFEDARACAELVLWKAACQLRRHKSEHLA